MERMTFKEFKAAHKGSGYVLKASQDVLGFAHKGAPLYGDCDRMLVVSWLYQPLTGRYTVFLNEPD